MRRIPTLLVLGLAILAVAGLRVARGGQAAEVPVHATRPPGAGFEEEMKLGRAQKVVIARETIFATVRSLIHRPICTSSEVCGRVAARLGARAREVAMIAGPPGPSCAHSDHPHELGGRFGGMPTAGRITLHATSESSILSLLGLISAAERRIDLMMYAWEDDATGREVALALANAACRGVRVRLMIDRTSFLIHNPGAADGSGTFLDSLRRVPNVAVIEPPGSCMCFDHRKLAVVDGRAAWTGGMILTEAARRRWHNLAFTAEGPVVAQYACVFEEGWRAVGGRPDRPDEVMAAPPAVAPPNATVRLVQTNAGERSLKDAIYHAVDHARHHIYVENPYFTDEILTAKLQAARARGVDVRVVLTLRGNVAAVNRYVTLTANRLFRGGVRVYLYPSMTHVKAMSADGVWGYLGTGNYDELSLRNNREVGLSVASPEVVGELDRTLFLPDMAASQELRARLPLPRGWLLLDLWTFW